MPMRKLLIAAAVMLAMTACGGHKSETTPESETAVAQETVDRVVDLDNDDLYRPGAPVQTPTILDFNATWCGPCREFKPVFHAASNEFPEVTFVSIDVDKNPATAQAFGISSIPTVVFIAPDGTSTSYIGTGDLLPLEKFRNLIQSVFK